jgi:2,4-diketo-3-deoxy-L-fuconate hydrolase
MTDNAPPFALAAFKRDREPPFLAVVVREEAYPVSTVMTSGPGDAPATLFAMLCDWERQFAALCSAFSAGSYARGIPVGQLRACSPLPETVQVFCTGANYRGHVIDMVVAIGVSPHTDGMGAAERRKFADGLVVRMKSESEPFTFLKSPAAIAGPCDDLVIPSFTDQLDWEIELGAVVGKSTYQATREQADGSMAGYLMVNDLTARDRVRRTDPGALGLDWLASKGGVGFLPTGPYFIPREFVPETRKLAMRLWVNGELMQDDTTDDMIFDIPRQIEHISRYVRMRPGDLLCTGTPAGNGITRGRFLKPGDLMESEITGLGRQVIHCISPR